MEPTKDKKINLVGLKKLVIASQQSQFSNKKISNLNLNFYLSTIESILSMYLTENNFLVSIF